MYASFRSRIATSFLQSTLKTGENCVKTDRPEAVFRGTCRRIWAALRPFSRGCESIWITKDLGFGLISTGGPGGGNFRSEFPFDNYRSTSAYVVTNNGSALSWRSRRQPRLATSSCEAETVAACAAAKEAVLSRKWQRATTGVAPRTLLLGDNASSIKAETNGSDNDGSKHVDVAAHYVRERIRSGDISYHYVATTENIADC